MSAAVIEAFGKTARPIMRQFMKANSCIAAARTTIEVMKLFGLRAVEKPVCYAFQVPARKYARVSGFSAAQRADMQARASSWRDDVPESGSWNGHLLVAVEDRWLIDAAIDQAAAPEFGVFVPEEVFVIDTAGKEWNPHRNFDIAMGLVLDNGDGATLRYSSIGDRSYRATEAWTDEGLPLLAQLIATEMERVSGVARP